jgi:hypothetical protein
LERHKKMVRQLTSNHGYVKKDLWEHISYTLSQSTNKKFLPPQCACKWKNIKQDYKVIFFFLRKKKKKKY